MEYKHVVTSFLQRDQLILLLRRSRQVRTYQGKWAAVSGSLKENENPYERAQIEINEETALTPRHIAPVRTGELLRIYDQEKDTVWIVHPFLFTALTSTIRVNWENSEYEWVDADEIANFETVPSLRETFDRVRWDLSPTANLSTTIAIVDEIDNDRMNGASYLGRKAVEGIHTAVRDSTAKTNNDLFRDILMVATRLRHVQPTMASIRNTTGRLLHKIDSARQTSKSTIEYRTLIEEMAHEEIFQNENAAELVSRNLRDIIAEKNRILTHSYSSTVKRAIELCPNRELHVYVTESAPAFEGRALSHDLAELGFNSIVLPDTAASAFPFQFDAVVLGADSVLNDGSIVNKIGTKIIARTAQQFQIPVYIAAESSKLDCMHFLGAPIILNETFDLTPADYITSIITELGEIKPIKVRKQIESLVRELYT